MLLRGRDEVAYRRKDHRGRLTPGQEMEEDGNRRSNQPDEDPRMEKTNHAERDGGVSASRSTTPNGVSVVT
jgi:hypothetical protein